MGLPHILVRFYTNPDGPAARRTTVRVLGLLGDLLRVPGRLRPARPRAHARAVRDRRDRLGRAARCPRRRGRGSAASCSARSSRPARSRPSCRPRRACWSRSPGRSRYDLWRGGRPRRRAAAALPARRARRHGRAGALALVARGLDISVLVGWAFALAASTFCPLLLLGIWWERLTARGAAAGLVTRRAGRHGGDLHRAGARRRAPDGERAADPAGRDLGAGRVRGDGRRLARRPPRPPDRRRASCSPCTRPRASASNRTRRRCRGPHRITPP